MRSVKKIIIHCSDSAFGNRLVINEQHCQRGWNGIGYHYVITNGYMHQTSRDMGLYVSKLDGLVQRGRKLSMIGAHCTGHDEDSIGICLIGENHFTSRQLIALRDLLKKLLNNKKLTAENVYCHYQFDSEKSCPNIDIELIRGLIRGDTP